MTLTVLSVAYPLAPVRPDSVGGAEQILGLIDHALFRAGQRSVVIACEGSQTAGELISNGPLPAQLDGDAQLTAQSRTRDAIRRALRNHPVDLIHMHGVDFAAYLPETDVPVLATLHLPPSWYPQDIFTNHANLWLHCVSAAEREACPPDAKLLPDIPNGVPIPDGPLEHKESFALSLGRICPEKGFHLALEAARRAGTPFVLAGEVFGYREHQDYFDHQIRPLLQGEAAFIGPARGECKRRLLAQARCVLIPSLVPETSSLVALEAMAAGTPVIAFPAGALAGLVEDGKTGFLVNNASEMADAIGRAADISPVACRQHVAENFSADRMTARYLDLYRSAAAVSRTSVHPCRRPVQADVVRDAQAMAALAPDWQTLFKTCPGATPFQSPGWLQPWWDCFQQGALTLVAIRHLGELIGLAPLYIASRTVRFLGVGISDYGGVLATGGWERTVAGSVLEALGDLESEWDVCDLDELRGTSPLLFAKVPARYKVSVAESSICPQVELCGFRLSGKQRRNLTNSRHRLERAFPGVRFETLRNEEADTFVEAFVGLHEARRREREESGVLADANVQRFHRAAIPRLQREGKARLHVLRTPDRILSTLYCLSHGQTLYYYLGGFDPSLERLSPGSLLIEYALEQAREEGLQVMDFLRGTEDYKYLWGAVNHPNRRLLINR